MIYCPRFSVGIKVRYDDTDDVGEVVGIEANLKVERGNKFTYKTHYLILTKDGSKKKVLESNVREIKEVKSENAEGMNLFLVNSLLLSRHLDPVKIDASIMALLNNEAAGGDLNEQHEGLL